MGPPLPGILPPAPNPSSGRGWKQGRGRATAKTPPLTGLGEEFGAENGNGEELLFQLFCKWPEGKGLGLKTEMGMSYGQNPSKNGLGEMVWG